MAAMASGAGASDSLASLVAGSPVPLAMLANGQGGAVPLALYPPGMDMSNFIIYDPATDEWLTASAYAMTSTALNLLQPNGPEPAGGSGGGDEPTQVDPPETGFYQVVQDGVQILDSSITNLTNRLLSGSLNIGFEAGNADAAGTNVLGVLSCAVLLIDGEKYAGDAVVSAGNRPWTFALDTAYLENGDHSVQVQVSWKNPDSTDNNHQYFTRWSDAISISVSNQIYYPDWEPEVGEMGISAYFLKTTCMDADWAIDIYDVNTNLVQTLSGHTMDGTIEAFWNMVDANGVTRTNADVDPEFSSIVTVADPVIKPTPIKKQRKNDWPEHGKWVIAYQDYFKFEYSANNDQLGSEYTFANTAGKFGGYYLYYPQPGQTNDIGQTFPLRYQKTNHMDTNITATANFLDQQMLRLFLSNTNTRNFYYDGHGDADNIVSGALDSTLLKATIQHRYRFVYLNACNSANGNLDRSFGIKGPKRYDNDYYHKAGIRPGAFVGYTTDVQYATGGPVRQNGVDYDDTIPYQVPGFIGDFLFYWDTDLMGYGLLSSIDSAKAWLPPVNGQYREDFLAIHGYFNLHIDEVNHRSDTW